MVHILNTGTVGSQFLRPRSATISSLILDLLILPSVTSGRRKD
jgi:hypothetical protein